MPINTESWTPGTTATSNDTPKGNTRSYYRGNGAGAGELFTPPAPQEPSLQTQPGIEKPSTVAGTVVTSYDEAVGDPSYDHSNEEIDG